MRYKAEDPDSSWVEMDKTLVSRNRKHLRRMPHILVGEQSEVPETKTGRTTAWNGVLRSAAQRSRSGRMSRGILGMFTVDCAVGNALEKI